MSADTDPRTELRDARARSGMSARQMAERIEANVDTYRAWEAGRRIIPGWALVAAKAVANDTLTPAEEAESLREVVSRLAAQVAVLADEVLELRTEVARLSTR